MGTVTGSMGPRPRQNEVGIIVKKESKLQRCDVCHKPDNFNQDTNYCDFCNLTSGQPLDNVMALEVAEHKKIEYALGAVFVAIATLFILSIVICFIYNFVLVLYDAPTIKK